jgi:hypothetical protein
MVFLNMIVDSIRDEQYWTEPEIGTSATVLKRAGSDIMSADIKLNFTLRSEEQVLSQTKFSPLSD